MDSKKQNIKALFSNTRTRIIIVFTLVLVLITITIGFLKFNKSFGLTGSTDVSRAPAAIDSIPGALNQTEQYASLQHQQNVEQAEVAQTKGKSSIPTIIRTQAFGDGVDSIGASGGQGSVGFSTLARDNASGPQSTLWFQNVKDNNCSKDSVDKAVQENNASVTDLKAACSCAQLKTAGFDLPELKSICSCKELRKSGYSAQEFKQSGYTAAALQKCGFTACEERAAGFSAQEMKDAGYSDGELKGAGFSEGDIARAGGIPDGVSLADIKKAGCSVEGLRKLRAAGVSAAAIRRINGCSAAQMKAAGFSAKDLKDAGFSAAELKAAGFSPEELRDAGFSARDLLNAGFTPAELAAAGYTQDEIKQAESQLPPGITEDDIKKAGCSVEAIKRERAAGVSAAMIRKISHCSAKQLLAGGFTKDDLARAGFTPDEINAAINDVSDDELAAAGCDPDKLKALVARGVTAKQIREKNGCGLDTLKQLGFSPDDLLDAGFTPEELRQAGISTDGINDEIKKAGCDPERLRALREKGVSAKRIHDLNGCSAEQLKAAGFSAKDLAAAGFTPAQLLKAGFSPDDLKKAGYALTPAGAIDGVGKGDCSVESLKAARALGVSAKTLKETRGCSAAQMKAAGYTAAELKDAGYTAAELKDAGFSAAELKAAGFSAKDLRAAGFSADDLKAAGFSAKDLKDAGFSAAELKAAGFSAAELKAAGFSAKDLKDAGFSAAELLKAGFSPKDLKDAGFSATQLKNAGLTTDQLEEAGIAKKDSALAGLDKIDPLAGSKTPGSSIPSFGNKNKKQAAAANQSKNLENIMEKQRILQMDQKYKQKLQKRMSTMLAAANQILQPWKAVAPQQYQAGNNKEESDDDDKNSRLTFSHMGPRKRSFTHGEKDGEGDDANVPMVKMGEILFAVIDTSVNSDEPGPILATIVTGTFRGGKLIGSFNLPSNADKLVISFNSLSMPGSKTLSINAFAIDPNTARTALSSETDHHYLERYGSLFASTFLEGFGNAFQSADTTIQVGGTGGVTNTTVQNGIGRSALENAVIGLATVGKSWGQVAKKNMSRPTTVQVFSGTAVGVLFTQDLMVT
ncbi:MAG: type IVB secretion system protein DotG/IcmE [Legionellaceae bacterium]|nr:type IVB secretion system protein DotG/IcmE [Legionellaceae bacterium]